MQGGRAYSAGIGYAAALVGRPRTAPRILRGRLPATAQEPVGAVLILGNPLTSSLSEQIVALAAQHRLPAIQESEE